MVVKKSEYQYTALITGGATGIGWSTACALNDEGVEVIICDNSDVNLDLAKREIERKKYRIVTFKADVSSDKDIEQLFSFVNTKFDHLNYLINNAGIDSFCKPEEFSLKKYNHVMAVNVTSVFMMVKLAIPLMKKSKNPSIVNVGSIHNTVTTSGRSDYVTSKSALIGATRSLSLDLSLYKIRVNMVSPGAIETSMLIRGWKKKAPNIEILKLKEKAGALHPMGRIGKPEDISNTILFLLSDKSSFINGINILVDGGIHAKVMLSNLWE